VTGASRFLIGLVLDLFRPCGIRQRGVGVPLAERWRMGRDGPLTSFADLRPFPRARRASCLLWVLPLLTCGYPPKRGRFREFRES